MENEILKITKGPWVAVNDHPYYRVDIKTGILLVIKDGNIPCETTQDSYDQALANITLIADAGNTFHESGLTPTELLSENTSLKERVRELEAENRIMFESFELILKKRNAHGWDAECSALVAEETLKKVITISPADLSEGKENTQL